MYRNGEKSFGYNSCSKDLTSLKSELIWLRDAESTALQSALKDLDNAYQKFFKEHSGFPKFKSKKTCKNSYTSKNNSSTIHYHLST